MMELTVGEAGVYALPLDGAGRAAERAAVARLFAEVLESGVGHYDDGAPYAVGREDVAVSVSHGAGMAVLAVSSGGPVGVDIESVSRVAQLGRVASRFVGPDDDPSLTLLELWTAKEAVYKAVRRAGLPLVSIAVTKTIPGTGRATVAGNTLSLSWSLVDEGVMCLAKDFT